MDDTSPAPGSPAPAAPETVAPAAAPAPVATPAAPAVESTTVAPVEQVAPEAAPAEPAAEPAEQPAPDQAPEQAAEQPAPEAEAEPEKPAYTDFKWAEGVKTDPEQIAAYTGILSKHGISQEAGQELVDLYQSQMQQQLDALRSGQVETHEKQIKSWTRETKKSFGNRFETVLIQANNGLAVMFPDAKDRSAFFDLMSPEKGYGLSNHRLVIQGLADLAKRYGEPKAPTQGNPVNTKPGRAADRRYSVRS